jgi:hypothetical protein
MRNNLTGLDTKYLLEHVQLSPMDQFEIKPFFGQITGLNYLPVGHLTNIMVYICLVVAFIIFFYIYGTFKENIKING